MFWTTFIGTVIILGGLYSLVWTLLLIMFSIENSRICRTFKEAFDAGKITTSTTMADSGLALKLIWPDGKGEQYVIVNEAGQMLSPVQWNTSSRRLGLTKLSISRSQRKRIEPKTMEYAAMYKLQHGPLNHQFSGDGAAMSNSSGP